MFESVKKSHPQFEVGKTLIGVILDWSDQQMRGLEAAVGKDTAAYVAKGCRVHYTRSVKRVSERVNKGDALANKAFCTIAQLIPDLESEENVLLCFDVLAGKRNISDASAICKQSVVVKKYAESTQYNPCNWRVCSHWAEWWKRPRHLRK